MRAQIRRSGEPVEGETTVRVALDGPHDARPSEVRPHPFNGKRDVADLVARAGAVRCFLSALIQAFPAGERIRRADPRAARRIQWTFGLPTSAR
jgi:hypothetical protein